MLYCWFRAFRAARRRGEARVIPRMTHPETTITRPHQKFTLKPRSPSGADPDIEAYRNGVVRARVLRHPLLFQIILVFF
jgi:hypothetical protein